MPSISTSKPGWSFSLSQALFLLSCVLSTAGGQEIGVEICSCAPNTYEFELDFSLFCPPVNITVGDAVAATSCMTSPFEDPNVFDMVPVSVSSIDILELNQNLQIVVQENLVGNFADGDTFQYSSYAALPGEVVDPVDLPRAIQINIIGVNVFDEPIINVYIITFTNNCGQYPVLFEGQYAGWTRFRDLGPPEEDLCPLGTPAPTTPDTEPPTMSPTLITPPPSMMSMSMSFSMSMGMEMGNLGDLSDMLQDLDSFMEFGRAQPVMRARENGGPRKKIQSDDVVEKAPTKVSEPYASSEDSHSMKYSKSGKSGSSAKGSKGSKSSKKDHSDDSGDYGSYSSGSTKASKKSVKSERFPSNDSGKGSGSSGKGSDENSAKEPKSSSYKESKSPGSAKGSKSGSRGKGSKSGSPKGATSSKSQKEIKKDYQGSNKMSKRLKAPTQTSNNDDSRRR